MVCRNSDPMVFCPPTQPQVYRIPYVWYFEPISMLYLGPIHGISNILSMVYQTPYLWYVEPATHGILNPLPMVCRTHYPWYSYRPTHGILNPLPMVY